MIQAAPGFERSAEIEVFAQFPPVPAIPDNLYDTTDFVLDDADRQRMNTLQSGDPIASYWGTSHPREVKKIMSQMIYEERAAKRLGVLGDTRPQLPYEVIETLSAQRELARMGLGRLVMQFVEPEATGEVCLVRCDLAETGSFKARGAHLRMAQLTEQERDYGVVTISAGNHAQGVALAAQKIGTTAHIIMPNNVPVKKAAVARLGGDVISYGVNYSQASNFGREWIEHRPHLTYIPPFDDLRVILGQSTIAAEIFQTMDKQPDRIYVPVGGGGLLAGIARYVHALRPETEVIGVQIEGSTAMSAALKIGRPVTINVQNNFADGVAVPRVGDECFKNIRGKISGVVTVSNLEVAQAMMILANRDNAIVEPAGALAFAAYRKDSALARNSKQEVHTRSVVICSGGNVDPNQMKYAAQLACTA